MEFKVGDKVVVKTLWTERASVITEITKAGNIRVEGEKGMFNKEGIKKPAAQRNALIHLITDGEYEQKKAFEGRPIVHFEGNGESGNICYIMARVSEVITDPIEFKELWEKVKQGTYTDALAAIRKKVNLIDDDGVY